MSGANSPEKSPASQPDRAEDTGPVLQWTCHPVKRRPLVSAAVTLFVLLVVVMVYYATMSKALAVLAGVIFFLSLARFYFPTSYRLSDKGITIKTITQTLNKQWSLYRSCYPDKNGILLSPFLQPSRLENFRGIYLMFANNRDQVTQFVRPRIGRKAETEESETEGQS